MAKAQTKKGRDYPLDAPAGSLAVATTGGAGGPGAVALFNSGDVPDSLLKGFEQMSLPPIVKPREMPSGAFFVAEITGIMDSPIKEYRNRILQLRREGDGFKFCFPMTAVLSKALGNNDAEQDDKIGCTILVRKDGTKPSKKGKKDMNLFSIYLRPKN